MILNWYILHLTLYESFCQDFVSGLSILLRGSVQEKLNWAFNLYDINKDGYITKEEMLDIMKAIYDMMGKCTYPALKDEAPRQHVEIFFQCHCIFTNTAPRMHNQAQFLWAEQPPKACLSATQREGKPSSPPLRVIAMTDRRIPRDCCPIPAVLRMCQIVSPDLPC
ncbi:UNVERIFIED_CONTAM: hypothetical protein FKN15_025828 [Acipenser sinensis]